MRDELNRRAARVMAVLRPLRVVIDNYPAEQVEMLGSDGLQVRELRRRHLLCHALLPAGTVL